MFIYGKKLLADLKFTFFVLKSVIGLQSAHIRDKKDYFHCEIIQYIGTTNMNSKYTI